MAYSYKTAIEFGLVYIPVILHSAVKSKDISFHMLHKKSGERIKYKKTCQGCPANVPIEDIVRGYEYQKGKYITLTNEELEKLKSPKDKSLPISEFVDKDEIDPIYFDKAFYLMPQNAEKAFNLLLQALTAEKKVAIAKTVLGSKEQVIAIRAEKGKLLLSTLHFHDEIVAVPEIKNKKATTEELSLARNLIKNMTGKFEPEKYKDEYRHKVELAIKAKINGQKFKASKSKKLPSNVINLMDALKKSLEDTKPAKKAK